MTGIEGAQDEPDSLPDLATNQVLGSMPDGSDDRSVELSDDGESDREFALPRGGALVIVATPIGNMGDISARAIAALRSADLVCCEDTRHTGKLLKRLDVHAKKLISVHAHNEAERAEEITERIGRGQLVVLVSDAGTPAISDPGERLVQRIIAAGQLVTTVPGPSAAISALVVSGLGTERFSFEGFLPRKGEERVLRLAAVASSDATSVIYESPVRLMKTLAELHEVCGGARQVAIARELTKLHEQVWRGSLDDVLHRTDVVERGEHVVVVAPANKPHAVEGEELYGVIRRLRGAGLGRRDCVSALEILLGVRHRVAYQATLELEAEVEKESRTGG
jgi:16S rRNA (cytidine1402-2'-O)-methyltransferase